MTVRVYSLQKDNRRVEFEVDDDSATVDVAEYHVFGRRLLWNARYRRDTVKTMWAAYLGDGFKKRPVQRVAKGG